MTSPDDREQEYQRKEQELQEREQALRLRELETEIYHQQSSEPPLYKTKKYSPLETSKIQKIVKIAKFVGFLIIGIAIVRVGLMLGVLLTYALVIGVIGYLGYNFFLANKKSSK